MINTCAKFLFFALCAFNFSAMAFESEFIATQKADLGSLTVSAAQASNVFSDRATYTSSSGKYSGSESSQIFNVGFNKNFAETFAANFSGEFVNRRLSINASGAGETVDSSSNSMGLRSIAAGIKGGMVFEPASLVYGFDTRLTPGPTRLGWGQNKINNTYLGYNSYSPWIGVESYIGQIAVHAATTYNLYSSMKEESSQGVIETAAATDEYTVQAGFEMPAAKAINIGLTANLGRTDANYLKMLTGEANSLYGAKIYGSYNMDNTTALNLSLTGESRRVPFSSENSAIELGMRRAL